MKECRTYEGEKERSDMSPGVLDDGSYPLHFRLSKLQSGLKKNWQYVSYHG